MVRIINPDGSGLTSVDEFTSGAMPGWSYLEGFISWSPDANWLAYIKRWYDGNYTYTLNMVNVNSLTKHQLTAGYSDYAPFWSPTGSQILFSDSRYYSSRDDSDLLGVGTNNGGDLLLINLIGEYSGTQAFPWPMFLPAIQEGGKK
jgi:Tol biopolymer transport system component